MLSDPATDSFQCLVASLSTYFTHYIFTRCNWEVSMSLELVLFRQQVSYSITCFLSFFTDFFFFFVNERFSLFALSFQ